MTPDPTPAPELAPADSHHPGTLARRVMRGAERAVLATAQRDADGWPCPSLILAALDYDGTPLLLISGLAEHSRNLREDSRVGVLFDAASEPEQPMSGARVSVLGRARRSAEDRHLARYLARHPAAAPWAGFGDFAPFAVTVERAHLVAGFGRAYRIPGAELLVPAVDAPLWAEAEPRLLEALNHSHGAGLGRLLGAPGESWRLTGIDPDGCDLRPDPKSDTPASRQSARLEFAEVARDPLAAQNQFVRLALAGGGTAPLRKEPRPAPE